MSEMKRSTTLLILLILLPLASVKCASDRPVYQYTYYVSREGYINVSVTFIAKNEGYSWLLVPRYEPWNLTVTHGEIREVENKPVTIFYNNYSFYYSGTPATFELSFSYRFGALIVEPNGAFFSTQITVSPSSTGSVLVVMPEDFKAKGSEPWWSKKWAEAGYTYYKYDLPRNGRILISFEVESNGDLVEIEGDGITIHTPRRYIDVAENLTDIYDVIKSRIIETTATNIEHIHVYFYVPKDMDEILELGYTPFSMVSNKLGDVYINLITVRMISGASEQAMLHEIIHHYLWKAGIDVNLLWVHEGLANYLSTEFLKDLGYPAENLTYEDLNEVPQTTRGKYGFLQDWRPGDRVLNIGLYYAASLYIIKTIGDQYGGLRFYSKLFKLIVDDKATISSTGQFVDYLSKAAGSDLTPMFKSWGFSVERPGVQVEKERDYLLYVIAGLIVVLVVVLAREVLKPSYYAEEEYYYIV
ncbi:MAG: hypothetical protein DRN81_00385 [Thermoproteota archaeon]|nr:MAG: hypothetical protein DRN81_00385 [Candidatus Korarchaeota archaeon]